MTSTALLEERVLKTDALGRVWTSAERREALLDEFEKSSMSAAKFAYFVGIKYQTLASWVQRRRRDQRKRAANKAVQTMAPPARFVEALVETPATSGSGAAGALRIDLPRGASVEIASRQQIWRASCCGSGKGVSPRGKGERALRRKAVIEKMPEQSGDVPLTYADISEASALLGYDPRTKIADGIPKFVEWFRTPFADNLKVLVNP